MRNLITKLAVALSIACAVSCSTTPTTAEIVTSKHEYKVVRDSISLTVEVVADQDYLKGKAKPAVIFFFGGGWNSGTPEQFRKHAEYLVTRGFTSFLVDYRTFNKHDSPPITSLMDAKSAIRYIRTHAEEFNIDPDRMIGSGGSAGGHLAAASVMCPLVNDIKDDKSISTDLSGLILFNPVLCNGPETYNYGFDRVADYYEKFSPMHNIREGATPPMIFMVGSKDKLIPEEMAREFQSRYAEVGGRCKIKIYEGQEHGFFNGRYSAGHKNRDLSMFIATLKDTEQFLRDEGYVKGKISAEEQVDRWIEITYPEYAPKE